jgi:hypothetical protein
VREGCRAVINGVYWCKRAAQPRFDALSAAQGKSPLRICSFAEGTRSNPRDALLALLSNLAGAGQLNAWLSARVFCQLEGR